MSTSYLFNVLDLPSLEKSIESTIKRIEATKLDFDSIAFRGLSGSIVAPIIALRMKKILIAVRKEKNRHSSYDLEFVGQPTKYIIIDDIVSSGETVREIDRAIEKQFPTPASATLPTAGPLGRLVAVPPETSTVVCVGIFLYGQSSDYDVNVNGKFIMSYGCRPN